MARDDSRDDYCGAAFHISAMVLTLVIMGCGKSSLTGSSQNTENNRRVNVQTDTGGSNAADAGGSNKNTSTGGQISSNDPTKTDAGKNPGANAPSTPPIDVAPIDTKTDASKAATSADFKSWCKLSATTKPMAVDRVLSLQKELCEGENPKALLTSTLIAQAYVGTGEPSLFAIKDISSDPATKVTSYRFGIAIKLPLSMKDHFDKVAPKSGDISVIKALQESTGATSTVTLLNSYNNDETYQIRGWLTNSVSTKRVFIATVTVDADTRNDQFKFKEGELYMYTQYTAVPRKTIKYFDMVTAGVQIGGNAYLVTVVGAALENLGFTSVAEAEVHNLAVAGIKQMYLLSKASSGP